MRRVVIQEDLREAQIRPDSGFSNYIELLERDFVAFLTDIDLVALDSCPACGSEETRPDFQRMGVQYLECERCRTTYVSPRPTREDLDRFYDSSEAIQFWNKTVAEDTAPARRKYIFGPRASWVLETTGFYGDETGVFLDVYSKYPLFLEEIHTRGSFSDVQLRYPMVEFKPAFRETTYKEVDSLGDGNVAVISAMEVVERLFDPFGFMRRVQKALKPSGLVFLTTSSISGFDLRILRGQARNLLPPTHLTLLSYQGVQWLLERTGFEIVELSTPGQLDVAIVLDAIKRDAGIELPPVVDSILLRRGEQVHEAFQDFLQRSNLSSHLWVAARKKGAP